MGLMQWANESELDQFSIQVSSSVRPSAGDGSDEPVMPDADARPLLKSDEQYSGKLAVIPFRTVFVP